MEGGKTEREKTGFVLETTRRRCIRSPMSVVSQIHSPHLHVGVPGIFSDLLRSVQMLKRVGCGKQHEAYRTYSIISKTAALFPEFAVEDLPSAELQPTFLRVQNTLMMIMMYEIIGMGSDLDV